MQWAQLRTVKQSVGKIRDYSIFFSFVCDVLKYQPAYWGNKSFWYYERKLKLM